MNVLKLGTVVLILGISGCASTRYLTEEEDAKMREVCEDKANGGCAVIPGNVWEFLQKLITGI